MLERLAVSTRPASPSAEDLAGTTWTPDQVLTGFGEVIDAGVLPGIPGEALVDPVTGPELRPGLYTGEDQRLALNAVSDTTEIAPAVWPARVPIEGLAVQRETILKGAFLTGALFMLMLDIIAALWLSGRLTGPRPGMAAALLAAVLLAPQGADAQDNAPDDFALTATTEVVLAHVITGDRTLDDMASAGLRGLSDVLFARTSIEPADPIAVDLEMDELSFFPILYWPVTPSQPTPSAEAYARLNTYLRTGGMIVFDTRDADISRLGGGTPAGRKISASSESAI